MKNRISIVCASVATVLLMALPAASLAQSILPLTSPLLTGQVATPDRPIRGPGSAYIGLVGDDDRQAGRGVRVLEVRAGGPAESAGIRPADLITGIGNQNVRTINDMADVVSRSRPGDPIEFTIERAGRRTAVTVVPTLRPPPDGVDEPVVPEPEALPPPRSVLEAGPGAEVPLAERPVLGIRLAPLDPVVMRRELPLLARRGVVIQSVDPGSPADRAGLPIGSVIVAVDGRRVDTPDDLVKIIHAARPGQEMEIQYYQKRVAKRKTVTLAGLPAAEPEGPALPEPDLPPLTPPAGGPAAPDLRPPRLDAPAEPPPADGLPPAVREVERIIGGILRPEEARRAAPEGDDMAELKAEIEILKRQLQRLEQRLAEVERRSAAGP